MKQRFDDNKHINSLKSFIQFNVYTWLYNNFKNGWTRETTIEIIAV